MGETLVGGLLVAGGSILGGLLVFAGTYWIQTRQWKREDEYRDYAERRQVYSEFVLRWTLYEEAENRAHPGLQGLQERDEAHLALLRSFNALSLIAPEEVRAAAHGVREGEPEAPGQFWKAARKDLGKWPSH